MNLLEEIPALKTGQAIVSLLDANGQPGTPAKINIAPPQCRFGAITGEERQALLQQSPVAGVYDARLDRESAYEQLANRATTQPLPQAEKKVVAASSNRQSARQSTPQSSTEAMFKSVVRSVGSQLGRELVRG